ncbi:MAG: hypothetical protein ACYC0V_13570 [Armatimonadota bacterium]
MKKGWLQNITNAIIGTEIECVHDEAKEQHVTVDQRIQTLRSPNPGRIIWNPNPPPNAYVRVASMILGLLQWMGCLILAAKITNWATIVILAISTVLMPILMIGPYVRSRRAVNRELARLGEQLKDKLGSRYGDLSDKSPMLVYCNFDSELNWQFAWVTIDGGFLHLYAEANELKVKLQPDLRVNSYNDRDFGGKAVVSVRYITDSGPKRLLMDIPELVAGATGTPRSVSHLKSLIRRRIAYTGVHIQPEPRPPLRQILVRTPIAALIMALSIYATVLMYRLWEPSHRIFLGILGAEGFFLLSWIWYTPDDE